MRFRDKVDRFQFLLVFIAGLLFVSIGGLGLANAFIQYNQLDHIELGVFESSILILIGWVLVMSLEIFGERGKLEA